MRTTLLIILLLFLNVSSHGQNLVPNGNFEYYTTCPYIGGQLDFAFPWYRPGSQVFNTPDYYNACDFSQFSVPNNASGNQNAHSGNGYIGMYGSQLASQPNAREYLRVQLAQPLISGVKYWVEFYISLGDVSQYGTSTFGAHLSVTDTTPLNGLIITVIPQILNDTSNYLLDKINWTLIRGEYIATGGEEYLTIGNFFTESNSGIHPAPGGLNNIAYYLIDDVCVSTDTLTCSVYIGMDENEI